MKENKKEEQDNFEPISLSAALLAPINSIFEAQVHAARAFLNFILQMGFRHKKSKKDFDDDEKKYREYIENLKIQKQKIIALLRKRDQEGAITDIEIEELKKLNAEYGDLHYQTIDYIDNTGNEMMMIIPTLSLLPIKPLSISDADFEYEFKVTSQKDKYIQNSAAYEKPEDDPGSPWFLIKEPKSIRGGFTESKKDSTSQNIKINVKVGSTQVPYGLEKLLIHLTNSYETIDRGND